MNYHEKKQEMFKKYEHAVLAIAQATGAEPSVAQEMLAANANQGGHYPYVNAEEFKKDWEALTSAE